MLRPASLVVTVLMSLLPATAGAAELGPWSFRATGGPPGGYEWMPAVVPGCVHTDLVRAKKIADPFYGTNEKDQQWIEHTDWEYRSSFAADAALLAHERVDLVWKGLDTFAEVFVNGHSVLRADNMFRSWRVDVRPQLVEGANQVLVRFRSPIAAVKPAYDALGHRLPAINDQAPEMVSMFARKAPYHYGWDWGPRFVTSGIWRPATIEAWDGARLDDVQVFQRELTDARARLTVTALVQATRAGHATLTVTPSDGAAPVTALAALVPGENRLSAEVVIDKPERWWPNGLGPQKLYSLGAVLTVDGAARGARATRVGLRTLEVVSAHDKDGKSFTLKVNGAPVFMKGANYIPSDSFVDRVTPARRRALLQSAADAHMNMLRVWGGGIYEDDGFYDLADELGLLVWQDFMFACSMYPGDDAFLENVRREAVENVRRLRNHPSLALWAGNNEIEAAWQQWGWQWKFHLGKAAQATIDRDYKRLFHGILPRVVAEEDPGRFYTRSSPSANEDGVPPNKLGWGDNHYWGVWHAEAPYTDYATHISRFMSEYGFQSFPTLDTVARYAPPSSLSIDSPVILSHQRHPRGNQLVRTYMERDFRAPKDFASFLYLSQVLQATVIQYGAEAHRRRWPYNAGSLYWQLDDCWPVASWSGIDYYGRWKALHYAARRFFAPVLVSPVEESGNVRVFVVSDRRADTHARMTIRLVDFDGRELARHDEEVVAKANTSAPLWSASKRDILRGADPARVVLVTELREGATLLSRNLFSFMKTRDLALPPPELQVAVEVRGAGASVRVTAKRFARAVHLSTADGEGTFSDNFFDLLPGESVTVDWRGPAGAPAVDAAHFSAALRTMTVRDTY
ncbi:MAG TPA: glycoside hydrolase family 2 protein [Polyangia bacterium]|nr:glycoside hydrolase family 2 protein [Polyangia bacterium]